MRRLKVPLVFLFGVLLLIDIIFAYRLWDSGWPRRIDLTGDQNAIMHVHVVMIPFTGLDWLILALVIAVHAVLFYLVWKAWRSPVEGA
jgi:hypothetical protein